MAGFLGRQAEGSSSSQELAFGTRPFPYGAPASDRGAPSLIKLSRAGCPGIESVASCPFKPVFPKLT